MSRVAAGVTLLAILAGLFGCDDSQVWHEPDWSLARMQDQPRIDPFDPSMGAPPPHTVARGSNVRHSRPPVTRRLVERGRDRFEVLCAACHGIQGDGDSVVATKMLAVPPPSLLVPRFRTLSDAELGAIVERGYGLMPPYANELPGDDVWATVAYVRALQLAQGADVTRLPAPLVAELLREAP